MNIIKRLRVRGLVLSVLLLSTLGGCMTYTVFSHPEVEIYDEKISKYLQAEVQLVSNCNSCHSNQSSKYALYANGVNARRTGKTSLDKLDLLKTRDDEPDLRGLNNYRDSDFGYYYYAPWWFDGFAIGTGIVGNPVPPPMPNTTPPATGTVPQLHQISRRLSSERTSDAQSAPRPSSETKSSSSTESGGKQNSSETTEERRSSGRVR